MGDKVANHKSAIKRHKQELKHTARNRAQRTRVKNAIKDVYAAIDGEDINLAHKALIKATSVMAKASSKGAIHWKKVARKVSRTARVVNAMNAGK